MQRPSLADLPPPPPGRIGWPWTEGCPPLPEAGPGGWPRISIVTPSFEQGCYIEETIRSVLLQGYPDLDYIVMDGGSSDDSVSIIERYAPWLSHWRSGPDGGQADAVNAGLARATGQIFNFINSDDVLLPGALAHLARCFEAADAVAGAVINRGPEGDTTFRHGDVSAAALIRGDHFHQPGFWLRPDAVRALGGYDAGYRYCFDKKLLLRYADRHAGRIAVTQVPLVVFRVHEASKTSNQGDGFRRETLRLHREIGDLLEGRSARNASRRVAARLARRLDRADFLNAVAAQGETGPHGPAAAAAVLLSALSHPRARLRRALAAPWLRVLTG